MTANRSANLVRVLGVVAAGALITAGAVVPASATSNPPAPRSVKATPSSGAVTLTWTSGKGSTKGFNVYRSTTSKVRLSGPLNGRKLITATSYRSAGLSNGHAYWFVVQSVGGTSSLHAQAATVRAVPQVASPRGPSLSAVPGSTTVKLTWSPRSGGGPVSTWSIYRSTTTKVYASANLVRSKLSYATRSFTDTGLKNGTTYYYVVTAVNAAASVPSLVATAVPDAPSPASLSISNPDAVPGSDRFVMSRMEYYQTPSSLLNDYDPDASTVTDPPLGTPTWYRVHDVATVVVTNTGSTSAQITALTISDTTSFSTSTTLPLTVAGHTSVDIPVTFIYPGGSVYGAVVRTATLTISATGLPDTVVQLAGEWQPGPNRAPGAAPTQYFEPYLSQIVNDTFGWTTDIGSTGLLNDDSGNDPFGDEHVSNFWKAADASKPVTVTRIAAFTGSGLGALNWYPSSDATGCATQGGSSCHSVLAAFNPAAATSDDPNADPSTINPADAEIDESMLPLPVGDSPNQSFSPGSTQFGLQLGGEFSDDSRNDETNDIALDHCVAGNNCGHHMRFFPVIDANGVTVPNTWIVAIDLGGLNNDFNDDVLVVSNLAPVS